MDHKEADYLVNKARNEDVLPTAVHGSSVEAAIQLLSTGSLPTARTVQLGNMLYFVPRKSAFRGHSVYDQIDDCLDYRNLEDLEGEARLYGEANQQKSFLEHFLGNWVHGADIEGAFPDDLTESDLREWGLFTLTPYGCDDTQLRAYGDRILQVGLANFRRMLEMRKGVLIGTNENLLGLDVQPGSDDPEYEIMIHLPNGLDARYVQYVKPLGVMERVKLNTFLRSLSVDTMETSRYELKSKPGIHVEVPASCASRADSLVRFALEYPTEIARALDWRQHEAGEFTDSGITVRTRELAEAEAGTPRALRLQDEEYLRLCLHEIGLMSEQERDKVAVLEEGIRTTFLDVS